MSREEHADREQTKVERNKAGLPVKITEWSEGKLWRTTEIQYRIADPEVEKNSASGQENVDPYSLPRLEVVTEYTRRGGVSQINHSEYDKDDELIAQTREMWNGVAPVMKEITQYDQTVDTDGSFSRKEKYELQYWLSEKWSTQTKQETTVTPETENRHKTRTHTEILFDSGEQNGSRRIVTDLTLEEGTHSGPVCEDGQLHPGQLSYERFDAAGRQVYRAEYHYDEGVITSGTRTWTEFASDRPGEREEINYHPNGNKDRVYVLEADGHLKERTDYQYWDENHKYPTGSETYDASGRLTKRWEVQKDTESITYFDVDGTPSKKDIFEQFDQIGEEIYHKDGSSTMTWYQTGEPGDSNFTPEIVIDTDKDGHTTGERHITYEDGQVIRTDHYDAHRHYIPEPEPQPAASEAQQKAAALRAVLGSADNRTADSRPSAKPEQGDLSTRLDAAMSRVGQSHGTSSRNNPGDNGPGEH